MEPLKAEFELAREFQDDQAVQKAVEGTVDDSEGQAAVEVVDTQPTDDYAASGQPSEVYEQAMQHASILMTEQGLKPSEAA